MIYLSSFKLSPKKVSCPNIYPYNVFRGKEGIVLYLDQITVFYGNNGSGKSTLLNQIANKLQIEGREYATPNTFGNVDYCGRYVSECFYGLGEDEFGRTLRNVPAYSRYIKSEDILYEIKKIEQRQVLNESMIYDMRLDGKDEEDAEKYMESYAGKIARERIEFSQEKYSNGETALQLFDALIKPNSLYLLDEPEVSLSPSNQVYLAEKINEMTRLLGCQFIIATHSPFMLGTLNAKIYDLDSRDYREASWTELENVRYFYDFFKRHDKEFNEDQRS
ncbi:MAG: AAA family ATPase [Clostridia bacterium]|nr:AAA family ATPase [Clostridia bacterium]